MRVVRAEHQAIFADRRGDHVKHRLVLMRLDIAEDAPGGELLARQKLQFGGAADIGYLLVHAPHPEGQPAKAAFEHA